MFLLNFAPGTVGRVGRLSIDFSIAPGLMRKFPSSLQSSIVSIQVLGSRIEDTVPILQAKFETQFLALPPPSTIDPIWKLLGAWAIIQDHVREDGKALTQAKSKCGRIHRIARCSRSSCARIIECLGRSVERAAATVDGAGTGTDGFAVCTHEYAGPGIHKCALLGSEGDNLEGDAQKCPTRHISPQHLR